MIAKIEAEVAKFTATVEGKTPEQKMLLKVFRNLPAAKQQEFIKKFAASELARLAA